MNHYRSRQVKATLPLSFFEIKKDIIKGELNIKDGYIYDRLSQTFRLKNTNNSELIFNNIKTIGVDSFSNKAAIFVELEANMADFSIDLKDGTSLIKINNNIAYINNNGSGVSLSKEANSQNIIEIKVEQAPVKISLEDIHHILDFSSDEIKVALSSESFIIKTRSRSAAKKKVVGKPHEVVSSKTIRSDYAVQPPSEEIQEKTKVAIAENKPKITVNETNNEDLKPINLQHIDDGYDRVNCHNFVVSENSKGQFEKHLNLFKERSEGYDWQGPVANPYRNVLITPIALPSNRSFLKVLKEAKEKGDIERVMFDSGGFQVMTGSLKNVNSLEDLLERDTEIYTEEDWADIYILPDHPPVGEDNFSDVEQKIISTVESSLKFVEGLPDKIKYKSAPVFHAKYLEHINYFFEGYKDIIELSKFATYSAAGKTFKDKPRQLDVETMRILQSLVNKLEDIEASVHCLGVASPPAVFCLGQLGVRTFDSSTAVRVAATGKVLFPYTTAKDCSDRRETSINADELAELREVTGHRCPFCEDIDELKEDNSARKLHNLIVLDQLSYIYRDLDINKLKKHTKLYWNRLNALGSQDQISLV